jgi:hypothetical protein
MNSTDQSSFGVFKPVGHVVLAFPRADQAKAAMQALASIGWSGPDLRAYTDVQMLQQIRSDLHDASPLAEVGQELNLIRAQEALALRGFHWLVVHARDSETATRVAETARQCGARSAQSYGRFIIEELIEPANAEPQVAESPDRGLDTRVA